MAGPAKNPTDSMVLAATLAAVSSPGWVASEGRSAIWAGRNAVATTDVSSPRAYTAMAGPSAAMTRPATATRANRTRSATTITRRRSWWSASIDMNGDAAAIDRYRTTPNTPDRGGAALASRRTPTRRPRRPSRRRRSPPAPG